MDAFRATEHGALQSCERIVVKVGSSSLVSEGGIDEEIIQDLVADIAGLHQEGKDVILVTSGAVAAGDRHLEGNHQPHTCAAVGQSHLTARYVSAFQKHGITAGQILLAANHFDRGRVIDAISNLLSSNTVPIVNENDAAAANRIGDNDRIAARLAIEINADSILFLTDVNGVYRDGNVGDDDHLIQTVDVQRELVSGFLERQKDRNGIASKVKNAVKTADAGIHTFITNAAHQHVIQRIHNGEHLGTYFAPCCD